MTDEVKRRLQLTHLTYVDFLEALARITTFKPLPTEANLKECKALSVPHWYRQANARLHAGVAMLRPVRWIEEELNYAPLRPPLEALLALMIDHLDANHDGIVTRKELKQAAMKRFSAPPPTETAPNAERAPPGPGRASLAKRSSSGTSGVRQTG